MRARNIKPGFFLNERLADLDPLTRILFEGLWCMADREGRLEDRAKRIKATLLPYDNCDVDAMLQLLHNTPHGDDTDQGFIVRYEVEGKRYIQVTNFLEHQNPHHREQPSTIPAQPRAKASCNNEKPEACPGLSGKDVTCQAPSAVLIPDSPSLIPDSGFLIPDSPSLIPDAQGSGEVTPPPHGEGMKKSSSGQDRTGQGGRIPDGCALYNGQVVPLSEVDDDYLAELAAHAKNPKLCRHARSEQRRRSGQGTGSGGQPVPLEETVTRFASVYSVSPHALSMEAQRLADGRLPSDMGKLQILLGQAVGNLLGGGK